MKDEILENVWEAKEAVSRNAPEGFEKLVAYIKKEAGNFPLKQAPSNKSIYAIPKSNAMACHEESKGL